MHESKLQQAQLDQRVKALGLFEFRVLRAIANLGTDAYGAAIQRRFVAEGDPGISLGQIQTTLERLERKGLVSSDTTKPEPVRGGRAKRLFRVEGSGLRALEISAVAYAKASSESSRGDEHEATGRPVARPA